MSVGTLLLLIAAGVWALLPLRRLRELARQKRQAEIARDEAQAEVRLTEAKYLSLVNAVPQIVWICEADGRPSYYNEQWYAYSGIPRGNLDFELNQATLHPDDREAVAEAWARALREVANFEYEIRVRRHDGIYRWFLTKAVPLKDQADGRVIKWFGTRTDIHATKIAELQAVSLQGISAALLKAKTAQEVAQAIVTAGGRALGVPGVSLVWRNDVTQNLDFIASAGIEAPVLEKYRRLDPNSEVPIAECMRRQRPLYYSNRTALLAAYPKLKPISEHKAWALIPILDGPNAAGAVGFSFGETQEFGADHRAFIQIVVDECAQAILRSMLLEEQSAYTRKALELQEITSGLSRACTEADVVEVIRSRVFGAFKASGGIFYEPTPDEKKLVISISNGYPANFVKRWGERLLDPSFPVSDAFMSGLPLFIECQEELHARYPASSLATDQSKTQAIAVLPVAVNNRRIGAFVFSYRQPHHFPENKKRLMQTLAAHCAEALVRSRLYDVSERAVRARDTLISVSAHELLTPVTSSKLQMQLMKRRISDGQDITKPLVQKMIDQTERQLDRLHRLVSEMLDISRINLGKLTLRREDTDLSALVADLCERMHEQLAAAECQVSVQVAPGIHGCVDSYRVEQVLGNLLLNASRYAKGRPVQVRLAPDGRQNVVMEVEDQGTGIRLEDQERVFQRFERAVSIDEGSGLGLGLFIARQIVEAHGGTISLESEFGRGSRFTVRLPLTAN